MIKLALKNILHRPLNLALSLILFALGAALITVLLIVNKQLGDQFEKNLAGIDLVIGAKGSPLQLILCNMYHVDAPTGNINVSETKAFLNPKHPLIAKSIPLSLGDNYRGYRIVGTTHGFLTLYDHTFRTGRIWKKDFEVVVGAAVAEKLGLMLGSTFYSSHGFVDDEDLVHDYTEPFVVTGILTPNGTVLDQLIITTYQTVWLVHEHDHDDEAHEDHAETIPEVPAIPIPDSPESYSEEQLNEWHLDQIAALSNEEEKAITSLLISFRGRNYQTLNMQRSINENTNMQAATPAIEINRLWLLMGVGIDALKALAILIMIVSGISVFIALLSNLKERKYELALMRVMGASRVKLFLLIIIEGLLIAVSGYILGAFAGHAAVSLLSEYMESSYKYALHGWTFLPEELNLFAASLVIGIVAASIPAIQAYKTDIAETLTQK